MNSRYEVFYSIFDEITKEWLEYSRIIFEKTSKKAVKELKVIINSTYIHGDPKFLKLKIRFVKQINE